MFIGVRVPRACFVGLTSSRIGSSNLFIGLGSSRTCSSGLFHRSGSSGLGSAEHVHRAPFIEDCFVGTDTSEFFLTLKVHFFYAGLEMNEVLCASISRAPHPHVIASSMLPQIGISVML